MLGLYKTPMYATMNDGQDEARKFALATKAEADIATYEALAATYSVYSAQSAVINAKMAIVMAKMEAQKARMNKMSTAVVHEAIESTTYHLLNRGSAESAKVKLQLDNESQNEEAFNLDGKVTVVDANDFPTGQRNLFARIRNTFRFNCEEVIKQLQEANNYSLIALESGEMVGLILGNKETSAMIDEPQTTVTGYILNDIYCKPFLIAKSDDIKLIMLLEAMKKTKEMGMKYFSFEFESGSKYSGEFSPKKENKYFRVLENIVKKCNVIILKATVEIRRSSIISDIFEHVSYDVRNFEYEKASITV